MLPKTEQTQNIYFDAVAELGKLLGLNKAASVAFALLFTAEAPLSLDDLTEQAGVAKSSTSSVLKNLEQLGLTEVVAGPQARRKYYQMVEHPAEAIALLVARRLENMALRRENLLAAQHEAHTNDSCRFEELHSIYASLLQVASFLRTERANAWPNIHSRLVLTEDLSNKKNS